MHRADNQIRIINDRTHVTKNDRHARHVFLRNRLAESQNWRCCYCGVRLSTEADHKFTCTVEHLTRQAEGGKWMYDNCVAACATCNSSRGEIDPHEYLRMRSMYNG